MKFTGICVRAALWVLASTVVASFMWAQQPLPLDYHAVFRTHVPHINSQAGASGGAASNNGRASNLSNMGGSPDTVGPMVTLTTSAPEGEEYIAVDPTSMNNLVAVISDFSLRGGYNTTKYAVSFSNGGAGTWSENFVPLLNGSPATSDSQTWEANSDPVVAIDKSGNVFASNLYLNGSNSANGLYVSVGQLTSPDLGFSVAGTYPVVANLSPTAGVDEDKDWMTVDNTNHAATSGNVYVSWTHFIGSASNMIYFSKSIDHGKTWSAPLQVSDAWQNNAVQGSQMAVGPGGELYLAYEVFFVGNQRGLYLVKSTDGGQSFSPSVAITPLFNELNFNSTYRKNSFPSLAVSPVNGNVYVVYSDQPNPTVGAEVEFILSKDGGITFTSPVVLNNPSRGQQFFPSIAVDGTGEIHVSWFDTRNSSKNTSSYDIYATNSVSDGSKFSANVRVTPASIDAGNTGFIGDYMGIAASAGFAHPVWTSGGWNNGLLKTATLH
ncbi:MAG TPA: sialidase family protein [Terriglobia bacterium]|nr:sialidase family protein [Terriglobia bacterium]